MCTAAGSPAVCISKVEICTAAAAAAERKARWTAEFRPVLLTQGAALTSDCYAAQPDTGAAVPEGCTESSVLFSASSSRKAVRPCKAALLRRILGIYF